MAYAKILEMHLVRAMLMMSLVGLCVPASTNAPAVVMKTLTYSSSTTPQTPVPTEPSSVKLLAKNATSSTPLPTTKENAGTTKRAYISTESAATATASYFKKYPSSKGQVKSASRGKSNTSGGVAAAAAAAARPAQRPGDVDCDLPVLPRDSRLWRGNETHELRLPVTVAEECGGGGGGAGDEECPPAVVSWEGAADIQSGDILIVRIADALLQQLGRDSTNKTMEANVTHADGERMHHSPPQPAVYQVTRLGHEHCDVTDGMLLDITPLHDAAAKVITLYDKDFNEGVNLFIVVSESWGSQCVRLKVTVKSDNCGDSQDCSGKGVCYTNVSMEGYECECCAGASGPHCEERAACEPSPCLNNGICVDLTQPLNGANYHCLCPYGFTGRKCEKDPCSSGPCVNGGSCMSMAMNGSTTFHCACAEGWTGAHCQLPARGGACADNPCVNGICVEQLDADVIGPPYRCFCRPGYTGDLCELEYNECESSPCANGGTCTDRVGGFACACGRGYTGQTCQLKVDLCSPSPCPEHRLCVDRGNRVACECPRGFAGEECTVPTRPACDNNPCAHGGTCWNGVDSFYCSCRPGYTGKLCEEDFILETVVGGPPAPHGSGSVRELHLPLGLYHDRLHNVYIAVGTLGAAVFIVGVVVTACHCRVNKTYARLLSRLARATEAGPPHHWLQDKRAPPHHAAFPPAAALDTTDMYYTLDFSDSQSSPLIQ
ncbi:delta and Notch-like epidermal growth factor-related receptor isoform X2 [Plutella xylostella]|uniref:delta and Notch-like epidermal growth factor-related receptor isoform X2 n=1 Tax=Plutella xylostella TaxID=51655 RepID=UPI002033106B|nr:delta and Notch-like epidermal growth factor-related receptor isoform X2 [Plutella xylostella]